MAGRSSRLLIVLAAIVLAAGACTSDGAEDTADDTAETATEEAAVAAISGCGDDCDFTPPEGLANCVGQYTGQYEGSDNGAVTVLMGSEGQVVSTAFPGLVVAYGPDGFVELTDGSNAVAAEDALSASGSSDVADDGLVLIETPEGLVLNGSFDWSTCTGSGEWALGPGNGTFTVAQDATQIVIADEGCDGGRFVGTVDDIRIGPGRDAIEGAFEVEIGPDGVLIGGVDVDLDAICLSQAVSDGEEVEFDEVDDQVTVRQGDGFTSYRVGGDLLFDFNSAALGPSAMSTIDSVIASLEERFPEGTIQVLGHTDSVGSESYNLELSEARATSVAAVLSADPRTAGRTLEITGLGESSPVASNATEGGEDDPDGRQQNRRVEIVVLTE